MNGDRIRGSWSVPERVGQDRNTKGKDMISVTTPKFSLGITLFTPAARQALAATGESPWVFIARHARADWGIVNEGDSAANDEALKDGSRIMSAYKLKDGTKVWVITEAAGENGQREATTILLPEEY
jgi:hypothetical protein